MKRLKSLILLAAFVLPLMAMAQEVTMTAKARQNAYVGKPFQITFEVNGDASDFKNPSLSGLTQMGRPSVSSGSYMSIVNGKMSSSQSTSYTITVQADKEGTVTVGSASCVVGGKRISSKPLTIRVEKAPQAAANQQGRANAQQQGHGGNQPVQQEQASSNNNDIFLKTSINKSSLYVGEEAVVIHKLYTRTRILDNTPPNTPITKGVWSEKLNDIASREYTENYNGKEYRVVEICREGIYPQESGTITTSKTDLTVLVPQTVYVNHPFWGRMAQQTTIEKKLVGNAITIKVKPLPEAPSGFAGGVGHFTVKADSDIKELKANEAFTYTITVSGRGNLSLLETPDIKFPQGMEVYEPRIVDNISRGSGGLSGSRSFEWIVTPQTQGEYDIPAFDYYYFNPSTGQYEKQHCEAIHIKVGKGSGTSSAAKSDVTELNSDIHYIRKNASLRHIGDGSASWLFWLLIVLPIVAAGTTVFLVRRQQAIEGDEGSMRQQRATKLARKRLRNAEKYLNDGNDTLFYEEIYKALWGGIADRFNIQQSLLSSDTIRHYLEEKNVDAELQQQIFKTLADVDFARFAPGESGTTKQAIFDEALKTIKVIVNR